MPIVTDYRSALPLAHGKITWFQVWSLLLFHRFSSLFSCFTHQLADPLYKRYAVTSFGFNSFYAILFRLCFTGSLPPFQLSLTILFSLAQSHSSFRGLVPLLSNKFSLILLLFRPSSRVSYPLRSLELLVLPVRSPLLRSSRLISSHFYFDVSVQSFRPFEFPLGVFPVIILSRLFPSFIPSCSFGLSS